MGLMQGSTEWLPVSSSGHLVLTQHFFDITERTLFDAILHLGTLLAAIVYFRKDLRPLVNIKNPLTQKILIASIPIIVIGFILRDLIEAIFSAVLIVAILLIINGLVLMVNAFVKKPNNKIKNVEDKKNENNDINNYEKISLKNAIIIGLLQVFALLPGISRSGTTITTGRVLGINWSAAAKFSFFISFIPIAGAAALKLGTSYNEFDPLYIIGFVITFIVGYATIDLMMHVLRIGKFQYFGLYTIGLGVIMLGILFAG
jgi:undecaprenyl-diphosphatase